MTACVGLQNEASQLSLKLSFGLENLSSSLWNLIFMKIKDINFMYFLENFKVGHAFWLD